MEEKIEKLEQQVNELIAEIRDYKKTRLEQVKVPVRYGFKQDPFNEFGGTRFETQTYGQYMLYTDHALEMAKARNHIEFLRDEITRLRGEIEVLQNASIEAQDDAHYYKTENTRLRELIAEKLGRGAV